MTINYSQNEHYDTVSLNGFQQLIFSHLDAISDARFGIVDGRQLLESKESLRPMECDDILLSLRVLLDSVRSFEGLLKNNINVPSTVAPKRYKVFVSLNYTEEHIKQVIPLLSSFRSICLESSQETFELLEEIRYKVNLLLRIIETLEPETEELLNKSFIGSIAESSGRVQYVS